MNRFQKLLSYFYPLSRKITSAHSGELEIAVWQGHKVLNSVNANYSYGSLQRILSFALGQVDFSGLDRVLLLGLGGGSVVATLRGEHGFTGPITAVEIDPVVIQIAHEEFGIVASDDLQIVCADAFEFVKNPGAYELIIIDLFIDNQVPAKFLTAEFWQQVRRLLCPRGQLVFNAMSQTTNTTAVKASLTKLGLTVREFIKVERTNTVLLARMP